MAIQSSYMRWKSPGRFFLLFLLALSLISSTVAAALTPEEEAAYKDSIVKVRHIEPAQFQDTIKSGSWLIFFGVSYCPHCKKFTPTWLEAEKRVENLGTDFHLGKVECASRPENAELCIDQHIDGYPTVKRYVNGIDTETLSETLHEKIGLNSYIDNEIAKNRKVSKAIEQLTAIAKDSTKPQSSINPDGQVIDLTDKTFAIMTNNTPWFIMFHAPWCGHCQTLKPVFEQLAPHLQGRVNVGKVDCTVEGATCRQFGVRGYPTLKFMISPAPAIEYKGSRSFDAMKSFAEGYTSQPPFIPARASEIASVLQQKEVTFFAYYDPTTMPRTALNAIMSVASNLRNQASFYITPELSAGTFLGAKLTPDEPSFWAVKLHGDEIIQYDAKLDDTVASKQYLYQFVFDNRHPRVLHLDADNQEEVLGSEKLVVMAVLDPASPQRSSILKTLTGAAKEWSSGETSEALNRLAVFTWLDGTKWQQYIDRVYGLRPEDLPRIIIADPKDDVYYIKDKDGQQIPFEQTALLATISDILEGKITPNFTSGMTGRIMYRAKQNAVWIITAIYSHFFLFLMVVAAVGVSVAYGGIPSFRRGGHHGPKGE
ncbi:hypothetical protein DFS34DRAFT_650693 [Phlyctochytrium arcticum]|nr:hypothetical protein DFS34DRAFT_650693 [Phlyctochytrium arcticum]